MVRSLRRWGEEKGEGEWGLSRQGSRGGYYLSKERSRCRAHAVSLESWEDMVSAFE